MSQSFQLAVQLHKNGQFDQAELIYRRILDDQPDHADALHLLGVIAHQRGQSERAIQLIRRAIAVQPQAAVFYSNLAEAYRVAGDLAGAVAHSQKAIGLQPNNADAHNHLGLSLQGQGKLTEAVACYREAVRLRPDFALAYNNLGSGLRELGQTEAALAAFQEAVRLGPNLALTHSNLGQLLLETNQPEPALSHCREAVRLQPDFAEGLGNLGNVLRAQGKLGEAKECYLRALKLRPNVAMMRSNLGQALQEEGNLDEAIACYRQALQLQPQSARTECFLASALLEKELEKEALQHYQHVLHYQPTFPEAHNGLGYIRQEQGDLSAAIACYQEALRLKPDLADAHVNLGVALEELGELERGLACFRAAQRCDPECVAAYSVLATQLRHQLPEEDVAAMHRFLERQHLSDWKRSILHHGLAYVYDARKDYATAAQHARQANAYRQQVWLRQGKTYDRREHAGFVTLLIQQFSPGFFERVRGWGLDTEVPVFVLGLPRSGTTLLEQILASHPQVFGAGELPYAKDSFDSLPALLGSDQAPATCVPLLTPALVQQVANAHVQRLRRLHTEALRIVDKMPDNYLWLGFLATLFPRARFIYCQRDVRDVAVSCWLTNFKVLRWACDQEDIAGRIRSHQHIMQHWRKVLPVPLLEVAYEETVADLEKVARRLLDFCGLDWHPACLAFHQTKRQVRTASLSQVRQPIYQQSVQRWKHYEAELQPLFRALEQG